MSDACLWCDGTTSIGDKFCCAICELKWHRSEVAALKTQLTEAKKDSERLDAMIEKKWAIHTAINPTKPYLVCSEGGFGPAQCHPQATGREAIDAAIAAAKEG